MYRNKKCCPINKFPLECLPYLIWWYPMKGISWPLTTSNKNSTCLWSSHCPYFSASVNRVFALTLRGQQVASHPACRVLVLKASRGRDRIARKLFPWWCSQTTWEAGAISELKSSFLMCIDVLLTHGLTAPREVKKGLSYTVILWGSSDNPKLSSLM